MTIEQFNSAMKLAASKEDINESIVNFYGFGLTEFKPVYVTIRQVAALIRYQAQYMLGGWDQEAIREIKEHGRKKFIIY